MRKALGVILLFVLGSAQAALVDRGGGFIYDTEQDVTRLQDANHAQTSGFDADGMMTWDIAVFWADGLSVYDSVRDVTYDDWRLATTLQPDPSCSYQSGVNSIGYDCTGSEMGHLYNVDGGQLGLFTNLQSNLYWSGTEYAPITGHAYALNFNHLGGQNYFNNVSVLYALAVRSGDVAAKVVPIPSAVYLFGSGLGLLGWFRRKKA
jgi:hypothetical protein